MPAKVKPAISFRELNDELKKLAEEVEYLPWEKISEVLGSLSVRIDTECINYGTGYEGPSFEDAHKMPSREYWRYEFVKAVLPVCMNGSNTDPVAQAIHIAERTLAELEGCDE